jgi:hypothetical protein
MPGLVWPSGRTASKRRSRALRPLPNRPSNTAGFDAWPAKIHQRSGRTLPPASWTTRAHLRSSRGRRAHRLSAAPAGLLCDGGALAEPVLCTHHRMGQPDIVDAQPAAWQVHFKGIVPRLRLTGYKGERDYHPTADRCRSMHVPNLREGYDHRQAPRRLTNSRVTPCVEGYSSPEGLSLRDPVSRQRRTAL